MQSVLPKLAIWHKTMRLLSQSYWCIPTVSRWIVVFPSFFLDFFLLAASWQHHSCVWWPVLCTWWSLILLIVSNYVLQLKTLPLIWIGTQSLSIYCTMGSYTNPLSVYHQEIFGYNISTIKVMCFLFLKVFWRAFKRAWPSVYIISATTCNV